MEKVGAAGCGDGYRSQRSVLVVSKRKSSPLYHAPSPHTRGPYVCAGETTSGTTSSWTSTRLKRRLAEMATAQGGCIEQNS
ncbi:unnamed protein product [Vitrella brassicaformis CCMP3155]|uniref:Uncharacterized protein n=1 Tax=Vitrella brassicaformis (strain CCMP3155) TaxID=1169540 RepID=A0A0G4EQK2_VITBC|nr:unnamed protein product [Vitrella brassicaformis CCMP3155]|eukprot:CEL99513.1 unnamed protein product [Vitrella brassicaformis CCMP3155]